MTDSEQQTAAADTDTCNAAAPAPGLDWMAVVRDMSTEHVARLAVDASILRIELDAARTDAHKAWRQCGRLINQLEAAESALQDCVERLSELEIENSALTSELAEVRAAATEMAPKKAAPRKRGAAPRGR